MIDINKELANAVRAMPDEVLLNMVRDHLSEVPRPVSEPEQASEPKPKFKRKRAPRTCSNCGVQGHVKTYCPKKKRAKKTAKKRGRRASR